MGFIGLACLGIYLYSEQACRPLLPLWVAPAAVLRCSFLFRLLCPQNYPLFYGLSVFVWVVLQLYPPFFCYFSSFYDTLRPVRSKAAAHACSHILSHCRRQLWPPICYPSPLSILFYYGFNAVFAVSFFMAAEIALNRILDRYKKRRLHLLQPSCIYSAFTYPSSIRIYKSLSIASCLVISYPPSIIPLRSLLLSPIRP